MSEQRASGKEPRTGRPERSDFGRRVAARRQELGLTRDEVAARAGAAAGYIRYVEEHPALPDVGLLLRVAGALETTVTDLCGGNADLPPGLGEAAYHPELVALDEAQCRARLSTHGVGRVSVTTEAGPAIIPVNYSVIDDAVVFRTAPDAAPATASGTKVAFEVDHIDEAMSQGWSVLVVGMAQQVTNPETIGRLVAEAHSKPWAGGDREVWIRIEPEHITGRLIQVR
ncbi:helix-turn-helix domain-containing protein [Streptantibioticus ferralitis]|uniref:Pyridoxamine 5'-phosphate oxidase family protein n=1 Tax=Streptantibioticus ferralitis TaxID=236510 RepID=A0ABT5Z1Q3_9ACTN|nr:pyridoxamine 5'-phosphate oxidase family protein [Streptantibioticus ferralitis]MDF2257506.1 pyridoxamine 5'-phosphate oxidase family protein [Streptantibioticus ferralitis]